MSFTSWRGVVGLVKPTMRPGNLEELIKLMPDGVAVLPLYNNIRRGTVDELKAALAGFEAKVAELAECGVDLIHPSGAPPFMVLGYRGEAELIRTWERRHKIPIFTSGTNQIAALRALKAKRFLGTSYFPGKINDTFARYFIDAGFDVLAMEGMDVAFDQAQNLSAHEVYRFIKQAFLKRPTAQAIYMLGPGWRSMEIIDMLERDLGVPVVHPTPSSVWEIQKRLTIRQPVAGYGRLLAELP